MRRKTNSTGCRLLLYGPKSIMGEREATSGNFCGRFPQQYQRGWEKEMFEIDKVKFGEFVAQLRKEKGYTQKQVAAELFVSDKAVSKWERGVSRS